MTELSTKLPTPLPTALPTPYRALSALYASAGGAAWTKKSGWLQTTGPCRDTSVNSWYGVTCASGEVTALDAVSNNLIGSLPTELGDLTSMTLGDYPTSTWTALFSSNSGITGTLPSGE